MSLYLKYRPQDFSDVVGQEHIIRSLQNAMKYETVNHAYLFSGPRGTGKTSLARIIAKAINCQALTESLNPCNQCAICLAINAVRLVDLIEIDAASNRGIDEIRELREKIQFSPSQSKKKVYIIDEVHMLTKEAFNALLKTLEEPPAHAYFILATTEAHKIPETILSRCQHFNFQRITVDHIVKRLQYIAEKEGIKADTEAIGLIARQSLGGLRDAIGLFEQMAIENSITYSYVSGSLGLMGEKRIGDFFAILMEKNSRQAIEMVNLMNTDGQNLYQFTTEFLSFLREQMLLGIHQNQPVDSILDWIDLFAEAKQNIYKSSIAQLPLEIAIVKACRIDENKRQAPLSFKKEDVAVTPEKKADSKTAVTLSPELTLEEIRSNWQRLIDGIKTPFVRMSFLDSEPVRLEKNTLHLDFKSESFRDKISNPSNQMVVVKAFEQIFNTKITLKLGLKKIDLQAVTVKKAMEQSHKSSVIEMAEEVFGIKK